MSAHVDYRPNTVVKRNDVRMPKRLQDLYFAIEVLFQLLVKTTEFDGLNSNQGTGNLRRSRRVSQKGVLRGS